MSEKKNGRRTPGASKFKWEERRTPGMSEEEWRVQGGVQAPNARCVQVQGGIGETETRRVQGGVQVQDAQSAGGGVQALDTQQVQGGVQARDARRVRVQRGGRAPEEDGKRRTPGAS